MIDREFDEATRNSLEKVSKLLQLAARNPSQAEAAAATAKAQKLLAALNLDMAAVEAVTGMETKRADQLLKGGRFIWQRDLWEGVADLNFCFYFQADEFLPEDGGPRAKWIDDKLVYGRFEPRHRLVGRVVNIRATRVMAEYLQAAIERLTKTRCKAGKISTRSDWAFTYRRGLCDEVIMAIYERRRVQLSEETQRQRDAEEKAKAETAGSVSTSTALTLASFVDAEYDANADFVFGAGTSAKWAAERAEQAKADAEAEAVYVRWAARNPEKAREEAERREAQAEAKREREAARRLGKGGTAAYWLGRKAGKEISLHPQAAGPEIAGVLPEQERRRG